MNLSLPSLLRIDDRINMYHGIESRAPFLDYRLVEFCLSLSEEYKMRKIGGDIISKYILRQAYRDVVHPAILNCRIKIGFPSPVNLWLNGRYKYSVKRAYDVIKNIQKLGDLFDKSILKDYEPFSRKRWLLLQFAAWYLLFFENKTIEDVEEILFK